MKKQISFHVREDRADRVVLIATKVGFGEVVREIPHPDKSDAIIRLTSTGVLIVKGVSTNKVITLWLASIQQATFVYRGQRMPQYLYHKVLKNKKYRELMQKGFDIMLFAYQKKLSGKSIGVVFGSFAPLHQGHLDLIMRAKKENDGGCIVVCCGYDGDKGEPKMPHSRRYRYVREFFADDDLVAVYGINDTEIGADVYPNGWQTWLQEFRKIWYTAVENHEVENNGVITTAYPKRMWYVGDPNYAEDLQYWGENATLVDRVAKNPICATMIRQNPIKNWDKITAPFRRVYSHNILIAGTASEGKSTLTQDLGKYFNAPYSHEWARQYMKESCVADWELDGADYMAFLQGQYDLNRKLINSPGNHGIFFADSDSMVTRMYAEYYAKDPSCALTQEEFEKVAVMADEYAQKSRWDKIFLIGPHDVFVDDHERFMAHSNKAIRNELFTILCNNFRRMGVWDKVEILSGNYYENFLRVVEYTQEVINR